MANTTYDLGLLTGGSWRQWSDSSGFIYYENTITHQTSDSLPVGWEDSAGDPWALDHTKDWPQWNNQRTGRGRLTDPNPPPPLTYLEDLHVIARISTVQRSPQSLEPLYRRMMCAILQWVFTSSEGFTVMQEDMTLGMHPDFTVFRLLTMPGGSSYEYDFLIGETKVPGASWSTYTDHLHTVLFSNDNSTKNVYGMLQVGMEVQMFKYQNHHFESLGGRMHLVDDVHDFIVLARYMKAHPMRTISSLQAAGN